MNQIFARFAQGHSCYRSKAVANETAWGRLASRGILCSSPTILTTISSKQCGNSSVCLHSKASWNSLELPGTVWNPMFVNDQVNQVHQFQPGRLCNLLGRIFHFDTRSLGTDTRLDSWGIWTWTKIPASKSKRSGMEIPTGIPSTRTASCCDKHRSQNAKPKNCLLETALLHGIASLASCASVPSNLHLPAGSEAPASVFPDLDTSFRRPATLQLHASLHCISLYLNWSEYIQSWCMFRKPSLVRLHPVLEVLQVAQRFSLAALQQFHAVKSVKNHHKPEVGLYKAPYLFWTTQNHIIFCFPPFVFSGGELPVDKKFDFSSCLSPFILHSFPFMLHSFPFILLCTKEIGLRGLMSSNHLKPVRWVSAQKLTFVFCHLAIVFEACAGCHDSWTCTCKSSLWLFFLSFSGLAMHWQCYSAAKLKWNAQCFILSQVLKPVDFEQTHLPRKTASSVDTLNKTYKIWQLPESGKVQLWDIGVRDYTCEAPVFQTWKERSAVCAVQRLQRVSESLLRILSEVLRLGMTHMTPLSDFCSVRQEHLQAQRNLMSFEGRFL